MNVGLLVYAWRERYSKTRTEGTCRGRKGGRERERGREKEREGRRRLERGGRMADKA